LFAACISGGAMLASFVRKHSMAIPIVLTALFLMALPPQEARADSFNFGNAANFSAVFNFTGGISDSQLLLVLSAPGNPFSLNTKGSGYLGAWEGILLGDGGSISLADADLFVGFFGGNAQGWENFFKSWGKKHTTVPEPGTLGLLACGLLGLLIVGGRFRRRIPVS
jgi:hypothetical protein